jgi:hypothetical protein
MSTLGYGSGGEESTINITISVMTNKAKKERSQKSDKEVQCLSAAERDKIASEWAIFIIGRQSGGVCYSPVAEEEKATCFTHEDTQWTACRVA